MKTFKNPFEIGGTDKEETANLTARADLMIALRDIIDSRKWTQKEAAKVFSTTQPRISDLVNGRIDKFSLGMLIEFVTRLGYKFKFNYDPAEETPFVVEVEGQLRAAC